MKLIFAGTPEFARVALAALLGAGHEVVLVLTQPDRPGGRGMKLQPSAVKQFALEHQLLLCQPRSLRADGKYPEDAAAARVACGAAGAEVMVVAAYGLILPQWVLDHFKRGCLNIHASLLPRWRGAAPIHRAIEAGDLETGITIMQMDAGLDTGDMLMVEKLPIAAQDTTGTLHDKLAVLGGDMIARALALAGTGVLTATHSGALHRVKQPATGVTYAQKIDKSESVIDWSQPADGIVRRILALNPAPGASAQLGGEAVKIWQAEAVPQPAASLPSTVGARPGEAFALAPDGLLVQALASAVKITELQRAGGKRMPATAFVHGNPLFNTLKKVS